VPAAILTRPAGRNEDLAQQLTAHGVTCSILPALTLTPTTGAAPLPQDFDLVLFVSRFAVQCYLKCLPALTWPAGVLAAGVGPGTMQSLRSVVPRRAMIFPGEDTQQDSEALWQTLRAARIKPGRVLIVRGNTGRNWLRQQWCNVGVAVQDFVAYRRSAARWSSAAGPQLCTAVRHAPCVLLVSSAEGAHAIDANLRRLSLTGLWGQCRILTLHPRIAECVGHLQHAAGILPGHQVTITKPDAQAVFAAMLALVQAT